MKMFGYKWSNQEGKKITNRNIRESVRSSISSEHKAYKYVLVEKVGKIMKVIKLNEFAIHFETFIFIWKVLVPCLVEALYQGSVLAH